MNSNYEIMQKVFLFEGLTEEEIGMIISAASKEIKEYKRGDLVFSEESPESCIGFVLSGECEVRRMRDEDFVILNTLNEGDSFGILSVFTPDDAFPTSVFARKSTAVLFFYKKDIYKLIEMYPKIALNIINFMAKKIIFLNKKIATYSGSNITKKLASYLLSKYNEFGDEFPLNCKRCSEALGVGRASVYRALDSLVERGIITFVDKKIKIISPEGLERN